MQLLTNAFAPRHRRFEQHMTADSGSILGSSIQRLREKLAAQSARVLDLFRKWDIDGDGRVTKDEFAKALPDLGFRDASPAEIDELFRSFDQDGEGEISFRELHRMLRRIEPKKQKVKVVTPVVPPIDLNELRKEMKVNVMRMGLRYEMIHQSDQPPLSQYHEDGLSEDQQVATGFENECEEDLANIGPGEGNPVTELARNSTLARLKLQSQA